MWLNLSLGQVLVALVVLLVAKYLLRRRSLPPGPFPLPIIGNFLKFLGGNTLFSIVDELRTKHGDVFTFWMGSKPMIYICGWELIKEALQVKKKDFSGRMQFAIFEKFHRGGLDISFSDPSPKWNILRKIGHAATRKYTSTPQFDETVLSVTDEEINEILQETGPTDPKERAEFIILCIIHSAAFGKRYTRSDPVFQFMKASFDRNMELFPKVIPGQFIPLLKPFSKGAEKELDKIFEQISPMYDEMFNDHVREYDGSIKDFTDAVVSARKEADPNEPGYKELMDVDLINVIFDLIGAGNDTSRSSLQWALLFLAVYQDVQEKAAKEVADNIGDRMPTPDDRSRCPYLCAFISELLRMRTPAPFGVTQKTICDTSIGGYSLPAGSNVTMCYDTVHFDESYWKEPNRFRPERFLEDPDIQKSHYIPFSTGRRSCIGEKLALNQLFLIVARFLQRTSFTTVGEVDITPTFTGITTIPKPHRLQFKKRGAL